MAQPNRINKKGWELPQQLYHSDLIPLLLIFIIGGGVYSFTLLPGLGPGEDTAKFQFVGKVLGTPHATGYPLYIILNFIFVHIVPIGSLAYRVNLLSAVFSVATLFCLYLIIRQLHVHRLLAFASTLTFAFTSLFWSQSLMAEVYSLHALLMALVLLFFLRWHLHRADKDFYWACGIYALSFGHHLTSLMLFPAIVILVLVTKWRLIQDARKVAVVLGFIVLSALQYSYFFWRYYDSGTPYLEMSVPDLAHLIYYLRGAQFQGWMFSFSPSDIVNQRFPMFIRILVEQYHLLLLLALWGMWSLRHRRITLFLLVYFTVNAFFAINYAAATTRLYFIPNALLLAIFLASGLDDIKHRCSGFIPNKAWLIVLLVPTWLFLRNVDDVSMRHVTHIEAEILPSLDTVRNNALIVSPEYRYSEFFWYYLLGEGLQNTNDIYVMHHFREDDIEGYVNDQAPIYLPLQRLYTPAGLDVYFFLPRHELGRADENHRLNLIRERLDVTPVTEQLFLITSKNQEVEISNTESTEDEVEK